MRDSPTVTIRGQQSDDWEYLYLLLNEPRILRGMVDLVPYLPEEGFQDRISGGPGANTQMLVAEVGQPSGRKRIIGAAWLKQSRSPRQKSAAHLLLAVHPDFRSAQIALMDAVLDLADHWLGLRRIDVIIFDDDEAAAAFYGTYGFEQEAAMRRYALRDGVYHNARQLVRLRRPADVAASDEKSAPEAPASPSARDSKDGRLTITIRGIEIDDWEDVATIHSSANVAYYTLQLPYLSRDFVRDRLENLPKTLRMLAAVVKDRVVGQLGLHLESGRRAHMAGLGMMVHGDYQGRGVGTALMEAAIDLGENWLALSRIELTVFTDNAAGLALYRKFGFEIEGTLRDYAFRDGRYQDVYLMARIRGEAE